MHLTTLITSQINFLLYFKNGKNIQHKIFTIAKSFNETNNHVKIIEKHFEVFTEYVRICDYPQFQKLQKTNKKQQQTNKLQNMLNIVPTFNWINRRYVHVYFSL